MAKLNEEQLHACHHLTQELGELTQALMKMAMFGERPFWNGIQYDNVRDALSEWQDVLIRADDFFRTLK